MGSSGGTGMLPIEGDGVEEGETTERREEVLLLLLILLLLLLSLFSVGRIGYKGAE